MDYPIDFTIASLAEFRERAIDAEERYEKARRDFSSAEWGLKIATRDLEDSRQQLAVVEQRWEAERRVRTHHTMVVVDLGDAQGSA